MVAPKVGMKAVPRADETVVEKVERLAAWTVGRRVAYWVDERVVPRVCGKAGLRVAMMAVEKADKRAA